MNKNKIITYISVAAFAFGSFAGLANAQVSAQVQGQQGGPQGMQHGMPPMQMGYGNQGSASGTMQGMRFGMGGRPPQNASSTWQGQYGNASSTMEMGMMGGMRMNGIVGKVTDIESSYLTMTGRGMQGATTTFTVNFSASTTYSSGSTTSSLSAISVGSMIGVSGPVSTSTNTIRAMRIFVNVPAMMGGGMRMGGMASGSMGMYGNHSQNGSSTWQGQGGQGQPGNWSSSTPPGMNGNMGNASGTPPQNHGFFGNIVHKLFGWL